MSKFFCSWRTWTADVLFEPFDYRIPSCQFLSVFFLGWSVIPEKNSLILARGMHVRLLAQLWAPAREESWTCHSSLCRCSHNLLPLFFLKKGKTPTILLLALFEISSLKSPWFFPAVFYHHLSRTASPLAGELAATMQSLSGVAQSKRGLWGLPPPLA